MIELLPAAVFLLASHVAVSSSGLRTKLIARLGAAPYLTMHSMVAIAAFGWWRLAAVFGL